MRRSRIFCWRLSGAVDELLTVGAGDILIFLSGEREIREAAKEFEGAFARAGGRFFRRCLLAVGGRRSSSGFFAAARHVGGLCYRRTWRRRR